MSDRQCPQCWQPKPVGDFVNAKGVTVNRCAACREKYGRWGSMTIEEKQAVARIGVDATTPLRAKLFPNSKNHKLGGIPMSITSRSSCPTTCTFYNLGCYAGYHRVAMRWRAVGAEGDTWEDFCRSVAALPPGILWRHNVAGDLPPSWKPGLIDQEKVRRLVVANGLRRGFTFTHYKILGMHRDRRANLATLDSAGRDGFAINVSADSLAEVDALKMSYRNFLIPIVVVVPEDSPQVLTTPDGHKVTVCPAQTHEDITCATCGACANPERKTVIGFRAHGQAKGVVSELVRAKRAGRRVA